MDEPVYTTHKVSQFCSVTIPTVMSWVDTGKLKAFRTPGGHRRILHADLLSFLKKHEIPVVAQLRGANSAKRILIVDDEAIIRRVAKRALKKLTSPVEIDTAQTGFEAGLKSAAHTPDLIVLDINLPGIDGFDVCREIRRNTATQSARVLAISGRDVDEYRKRILACGADEFLAKPFTPDTLTERAQALLDAGPREA